MDKIIRYKVTYRSGTTVGAFGSQQSIDTSQPQGFFECSSILDFFNKLNQYLSDSCIYEDDIVDIKWIETRLKEDK
jgi:hypothetical protein